MQLILAKENIISAPSLPADSALWKIPIKRILSASTAEYCFKNWAYFPQLFLMGYPLDSSNHNIWSKTSDNDFLDHYILYVLESRGYPIIFICYLVIRITPGFFLALTWANSTDIEGVTLNICLA